MTNEQQIKAIAELDGWKQIYFLPGGIQSNTIGHWRGTSPLGGGDMELPDYLTSRDAIVPVIERQAGCVIDKITEWLRQTQIAWIGTNMYLAKAELLCEALLRANGKWNDET